VQFDDYCDSLPAGLASHPECKHKAAFYRDFMLRVPVARHVKRFPEALRYMIDAPPAPSAWLPEVHTNAFYLAARDVVLESDEQLVRTMYEVNRHVLSSPLNRIMFLLATPALVMTAGEARWAAFHEGSRFKTKRRGGHGTVDITYPKNLFPPLMMRVYEQIFQAVFDMSREPARVRLMSAEPFCARFEVRWKLGEKA